MLKKLIKYDFKNTKRFMIPICLLAIVGGIISAVLSYASKDERFVLLTIMGLTGLGVASTLYMVNHFSNSLFSTQGYLTNTLPATAKEIIGSKMIVAGIWVLLFVISSFVATIICSPAGFINPNSPSVIIDILLTIYMIFAFSLMLTSFLFAIFSCISFSRLCCKFKGFSTAILSGITCLVLFIIYYVIFIFNMDSWYFDYIDLFSITSLIVSIVFIAIFYATSVHIIGKKLNVE